MWGSSIYLTCSIYGSKVIFVCLLPSLLFIYLWLLLTPWLFITSQDVQLFTTNSKFWNSFTRLQSLCSVLPLWVQLLFFVGRFFDLDMIFSVWLCLPSTWRIFYFSFQFLYAVHLWSNIFWHLKLISYCRIISALR